MQCSRSWMRWMRLIATTASLIVTLVSMAACFPIKHKKVDHVVAVGWPLVGGPEALAQRTTLSATAIAVAPDGPGVYEDYRRGDFVLIRGKRKTKVELELSRVRDVKVMEVAARHPGGGFLLLLYVDLDDPDDPFASEIRCYLIESDGSASTCSLPPDYRLTDWGI